jgi:diacylglycerol kinase (ATP)
VRRALLIVNRRAREGRTELDEGLTLLRRKGLSLKEVYLEDGLEMMQIIEGFSDPLDLVIIGGGDGTLNSAAAAIVKRAVPLGIIPLGTANDLARTLGIPAHPLEACRIIAEGRRHAIDLGRVNDHFFFNVASIGLSTRVSQNLTPELKRRWGSLGYSFGALRALRASRPFRAEIDCDGQSLIHRSIQISIGNGRHYGGGLTVAENAAIDDGLLHLYSLEPQNLWHLARIAPALRKGEIAGRERILLLSGRTIEVRTPSSLPIDTDGELTACTPARFEVLSGALTVLVPGSTGQ